MPDLDYASVATGSNSRDQLSEKSESVLDHIVSEIGRLGETITDLERRLQPVLSPFGLVEEMASVPQQSVSPIREQRDRLTSQIGRLQRLVDQLEV